MVQVYIISIHVRAISVIPRLLIFRLATWWKGPHVTHLCRATQPCIVSKPLKKCAVQIRWDIVQAVGILIESCWESMGKQIQVHLNKIDERSVAEEDMTLPYPVSLHGPMDTCLNSCPQLWSAPPTPVVEGQSKMLASESFENAMLQKVQRPLIFKSLWCHMSLRRYITVIFAILASSVAKGHLLLSIDHESWTTGKMGGTKINVRRSQIWYAYNRLQYIVLRSKCNFIYKYTLLLHSVASA